MYPLNSQKLNCSPALALVVNDPHALLIFMYCEKYLIDKVDYWPGERCVVPTQVPSEHKLTAVWKLSDAPSKLKK